jgi:hypothetical protein
MAPFGLTLFLSHHLNYGAFCMSTLAFILQNQPDPALVQHIAVLVLTIIPIIIVVFLAIAIVPFWFILKKAGFSPWLSLIYIIPLGNLFLYYFLAFAEWNVVPAPQFAWQPQPPFPPLPPTTTPPPQA